MRLLSLPRAILKVDRMGVSKYRATRGCDVQASTVRDVSKPSVCSTVTATVRINCISQPPYCIVQITNNSAESKSTLIDEINLHFQKYI